MTINNIQPGDKISLDWKGLHKVCTLPSNWCSGKVEVVSFSEFFVKLKPSLPAIVPDRDYKGRFAYTFGLTREMLKIFCIKIHKHEIQHQTAANG
jgi:hypothetical protein